MISHGVMPVFPKVVSGTEATEMAGYIGGSEAH